MSEFKIHAFICTNKKEGKACCADKGGRELKDRLKEHFRNRPEFRGKLRVNASGCLGFCEKGINAVIYPKGEWHFHLKSGDDQLLIDAIEKANSEN
ncbi:MAG: (2Fe-2S) ferredoxin domain-containing protein [Bdellovibrionales bacterium]|nr:(2Fe-2S) ferredoxin domain-containing protein [Bdellovibrionales bacterium]